MVLTVKTRIHPTKRQVEVLWILSEKYRLLYNFALHDRIENWRSNRTLSHSLQNTGSLGRFIEFLTYKAEKAGKGVIRINERGTSRTCANCGKIDSLRLYNREIHCDCGSHLDRDLNAAINIMKRFLTETLSHQPSVNGESFLAFPKGFTTTYSPITARSGRW
jgi:transposase